MVARECFSHGFSGHSNECCLPACSRGGKGTIEVDSADQICDCLRVFYRQRMIHYKAVRAATVAAEK
jgi:hypothetical protein